MKTPQNPTKGFTLVEIMIVTVIIGLLAALAVPAFNKIRSVARGKAITNNLRQVASAAQQYMLSNGLTQVSETVLIGTDTTYYLRPIDQVNGEDYTTLVFSNTTTQISISDNDNDTITYNL